MKALNDALCLRSLESLSTLNVPIQHPSTWEGGDWLHDLDLDARTRCFLSIVTSKLT